MPDIAAGRATTSGQGFDFPSDGIFMVPATSISATSAHLSESNHSRPESGYSNEKPSKMPKLETDPESMLSEEESSD